MKPATIVTSLLSATQVFGDTEIIHVKNVVKKIWGMNDEGRYRDIPILEDNAEFEIAKKLSYYINEDDQYEERGLNCSDASLLRENIIDKLDQISKLSGIEFKETDQVSESQLRFHYCEMESSIGGLAIHPNDEGYSSIRIAKKELNELDFLSESKAPLNPYHNSGALTKLLSDLSQDDKEIIKKYKDLQFGSVVFHEILHGLGLSHTHSYPPEGNENIDKSLTGGCSIMSYDHAAKMTNWGPVDMGAISASYLYGDEIDNENFDGFRLIGNDKDTAIEFDSECRLDSFESSKEYYDIFELSRILQVSISIITAFFVVINRIGPSSRNTDCLSDIAKFDQINTALKTLDKLGLGKLGFRLAMPITSKISGTIDVIAKDIIAHVQNNRSPNQSKMDAIISASSKPLLKIGSDILFYTALNATSSNTVNWVAYSAVDVKLIIENLAKENKENEPTSTLKLFENVSKAIITSLPLCDYLWKEASKRKENNAAIHLDLKRSEIEIRDVENQLPSTGNNVGIDNTASEAENQNDSTSHHNSVVDDSIQIRNKTKRILKPELTKEKPAEFRPLAITDEEPTHIKDKNSPTTTPKATVAQRQFDFYSLSTGERE